jgi:DNA-binding transcriptional LysR family regulator
VDRLEAWTIFVAVAERDSFADAARRIGRSPAAVTRAIAALENRLSTRLLNRTTRSVALTDAGASYLDGCRRILSDSRNWRLRRPGSDNGRAVCST